MIPPPPQPRKSLFEVLCIKNAEIVALKVVVLQIASVRSSLSGPGDTLALLRILGARPELRRIRQYPQSDRFVRETDPTRFKTLVRLG